MTLDPSVAAVRLAVRRTLAASSSEVVLVACSGGADSLALAAATVFEGRATTRRVVGVTVDHGLQEASEQQAGQVVAQLATLGVDETVLARVTVSASGHGPEAAAREARYAVLGEVAARCGSTLVLVGHTRDDQAETVLLGLARGSGGRSLAGMRRGFDVFRRPLLDLTRTQTEAACRAEGIDFWSDPHNTDPRFTRARVRQRVLPVLEDELGPGVAAALARTADQLREDGEALDELAERSRDEARADPERPAAGYRVTDLARQRAAVLSRVLRLAALEAGAVASELGHGHVHAVSGLVRGDPARAGRQQIQLPGQVTAFREGNLLRFRPTVVGR